MRYYLLIGIILFALNSCNSPKDEEISQGQEYDYIAYNATINEAENFILDSNYTAALKTYKKAFEMVDMPLAKHCFTAMQVSAVENDEAAFKNFSLEGMKRGMLVKYYKEDTIINRYLKTRQLDSFVGNNFNIANQNYKSSINAFLDDTLNALQNWDQKWKKYYMDSLTRVDPNNEKFYKQKYDNIVTNIVENYLIPLIREHGCPGERLVGMEAVGYNIGDSYRRVYVDNRVKIILWHYYSFPRACNYNKLLLKEVKKGNLLPDHYASILDYQAKFWEKKYCKVNYYNEWFIDPDTTHIKEIDARRVEIGLSTYGELNRKQDRGREKCKSIKKGIYNFVKLFHWCG